eukprot:7274178-Prorocentrum_lima.AAC.1
MVHNRALAQCRQRGNLKVACALVFGYSVCYVPTPLSPLMPLSGVLDLDILWRSSTGANCHQE